MPTPAASENRFCVIGEMFAKNDFGACVGLVDVDSMERAFVCCVAGTKAVPVGWTASDSVFEELGLRCTGTRESKYYEI